MIVATLVKLLEHIIRRSPATQLNVERYETRDFGTPKASPHSALNFIKPEYPGDQSCLNYALQQNNEHVKFAVSPGLGTGQLLRYRSTA